MTSRVVVSMRVEASAQRAFEAFTDEIGDWWADSPLFRFTPRSPGRLAFTSPDGSADNTGGDRKLVERLPNGREFVIGDVRVWRPGEKLVLSWRAASFGPEHATEVEVTFEAVESGARITVEHRGWDSLPQEHVARHGFPLPLFLQRLGEAWRRGLARLGAGLPDNTSDDTSGEPRQ